MDGMWGGLTLLYPCNVKYEMPGGRQGHRCIIAQIIQFPGFIYLEECDCPAQPQLSQLSTSTIPKCCATIY